MADSKSIPHRRWFRFSLRTLFVVVTACAIGTLYAMPLFSSWWIRENQRGLDAERDRVSRKAHAELEEIANWVEVKSFERERSRSRFATTADEAE